jgi:hypothetical protein
VHLTPGSDYGWRGVTKSWPPYYPDHTDNAPPVLDIGKGSPTGIKFGTKSNFPKRYQESLFVSDWAYGRILAVSLTPRGGSFAGRAHTFLKGQPFNVTDLDFGPDGAMYLVTGGRKTQSALYRVRYVGPPETPIAPTPQQIARGKHAEQSRKIRHQLKTLLSRDAKDAIPAAWPYLNSDDPWIRQAAMMAVEHQPATQWREKALAETRTTAALAALMCLVRDPEGTSHHEIWRRLIRLNISEMTEPQQLMAVDTLNLSLQSGFTPTLAEATDITRELFPLFPQQSARVNLAMSQVLSQLKSPALVPELLEWLPQVEEQSLRQHALLILRDAKQ